MIKIRNLIAAYGQLKVLHELSFEVNPGEIVTLIGPNGAGKSTILLSIMGMLGNASGAVLFEGDNLLKLPTDRIVSRGVALVPENRGLFAPMTVRENLMLGAYLRLKKGRKPAVFDDLDMVLQLFPILKDRLEQPAGTMSGGQQQMVAIGKALMASPRLLLLDEPSLGLAPLVIKEIFKVVESLNRSGVTILLIEQNANLALKIAQRGYVVENGRISFSGTAAELMSHADVKQAYLGKSTSAAALKAVVGNE